MNQISDRRLPRREVFQRTAGCLVAALASPGLAAAVPAANASTPFRYCLNTGTIRGQELSLPEEIDVVAAAGYQAIEPWMAEMQEHVRQGGNLRDLRKRAADLGLTIANVIALDPWLPEASERAPNGIETWKRNLDLVAQLGCRLICAPPCGTLEPADCELPKVAARYRRLLELCRPFGVAPQVELWGFARTLSRLGDIAYVLAEAGDPAAGAVLDVIHMKTGGSPPAGLLAFSGASFHVFHMNDYPVEVARDRKLRKPRVYPGDGVAPLDEILRNLRAIGFAGYLSLEMFNETYWRQPVKTVARTGLEKMRAAVARALGG